MSQEHSEESQILPLCSTHMNETYDDLVKFWRQNNRYQTCYVCCVGWYHRIGASYHEHDGAEKESVCNKLQRVKVGEKDLFKPGNPISVNSLYYNTVSEHLDDQEEERDILNSKEPNLPKLLMLKIRQKGCHGGNDLHNDISEEAQQTYCHI